MRLPTRTARRRCPRAGAGVGPPDGVQASAHACGRAL